MTTIETLRHISEIGVEIHGSYARTAGFYEAIIGLVASGIIKPEEIDQALSRKLEELIREKKELKK